MHETRRSLAFDVAVALLDNEREAVTRRVEAAAREVVSGSGARLRHLEQLDLAVVVARGAEALAERALGVGELLDQLGAESAEEDADAGGGGGSAGHLDQQGPDVGVVMARLPHLLEGGEHVAVGHLELSGLDSLKLVELGGELPDEAHLALDSRVVDDVALLVGRIVGRSGLGGTAGLVERLGDAVEALAHGALGLQSLVLVSLLLFVGGGTGGSAALAAVAKRGVGVGVLLVEAILELLEELEDAAMSDDLGVLAGDIEGLEQLGHLNVLLLRDVLLRLEGREVDHLGADKLEHLELLFAQSVVTRDLLLEQITGLEAAVD
mmetsp:Transcript_53539/g.81228  ORF Transcript_53539/g.81228 Transcript_53539/m.81228 type:complete len:323 (-) Transcript_53539:558-1526(-)